MCFEESRPLIASPRRLKPVLGKKRKERKASLVQRIQKLHNRIYTRDSATFARILWEADKPINERICFPHLFPQNEWRKRLRRQRDYQSRLDFFN